MNWVHVVMLAVGLFMGLYFSKTLQFRRIEKEKEAIRYHYQRKFNERNDNKNGKVVNFPKQQKAANR